MRTVPSLREPKSALRAEIRQRRAGLGEGQRRQRDEALNRHLLEFAARSRPHTVSAYLAFDGEPDIGPTLRALESQGVRLALPVVHAEPGRSVMRFHQWWRGCEAATNRFGITEPRGTPILTPDDIDLALIPLVAWDRAGGRLGMGASYYDRLLQPYADRPRPLRLGIGYSVQEVDRVPLEPWDVALHAVLTEDGFIDCRAPEAEQPT